MSPVLHNSERNKGIGMTKKRRSSAPKQLEPPPEGFEEFCKEIVELIRTTMPRIKALKAKTRRTSQSRKPGKSGDGRRFTNASSTRDQAHASTAL